MSVSAVSAAQASKVAATPATPSASSLSSASAVFDWIAERYDGIFTHSTIGRLQRGLVWDALTAAFVPGQHVLELNCGTGEDALFLAKRGISVTACDASSRMIEVAQRRSLLEAAGSVEFRVLANEHLGKLRSGRLFDGAFSNFSGLNCVEDVCPVAATLSALLRPAARLLICISTRACAWEILWYLGRGEVAKAFRRVPGRTIGSVEGIPVQVWYPTLRQTRKIFAPWFRIRSVRALGLFVPPSYAEEWAQRHQRGIAACGKLDRLLGRLPILRTIGDHMLVELERTQS
jgi:SAM-dependent methyltransferase